MTWTSIPWVPPTAAVSVITGAGAIGLLVILLSRLSGTGELFVSDVQGHRLRKAERLGASGVFNNAEEEVVEKILQRTDQLGVDRSFEAVGLERTLVQSLQVLKKGGTSVLVGIFEEPEVRIPANLFIQKEISLIGSQGYCWDFQRALKLLEERRVNLNEIITHVLPLSSLQEAFELLGNPENEAIKVVIRAE